MDLANLAYTLSGLARGTHRLAIVAKDIADLQTKLHLALEKLTDLECTRLQIQSGIYYTDPKSFAEPGKTAFLFPGEGSQYPNMLADLCLHFPKVRAWFDTLDENFPDKNEYLPSSIIFPPPTCTTDEERNFIAKQLFSMKVAPGALLVANLALYDLLSALGIGCDIMVGHSSGEHAALTASGTVPRMEQGQLINKFRHLNQIYTDLEAQDSIPKGALLSVGAIDPALLKQFVDSSSERLHLAMDNCRNQAVLFGSEADIDEAATQLKKAGGICVRLPFDRAYHTPLFEEVEAAFRPYYDDLEMIPGHTRLYSCVTCEAFPEQPEAIHDLAIKHMSARVRFRETVEKLYDLEQVRTFITVGPGDDLTAFVNDILGDRDYLAVASNTQRKSGLEQIQHLLARLFTNRRVVDITHLYKYRELTQVSLDAAIPLEVNQKPKPVLDLTMPIMRLKPDFVSSIQDKLYPELQSRGSDEAEEVEEVE
ncbi:MAG TPA: 6-deoxyerythronolide-B synthase, partial [Cyanobacteria bacterium UBA11049]|nr:6-deoxyerythronolide-B synthase [Cyanobacteria bacterium UBA11049]